MSIWYMLFAIENETIWNSVDHPLQLWLNSTLCNFFGSKISSVCWRASGSDWKSKAIKDFEFYVNPFAVCGCSLSTSRSAKWPAFSRWHFANVFFLQEKFSILIQISLKFLNKGTVDNTALLKVMAWCLLRKSFLHFLLHSSLKWIKLFIIIHVSQNCSWIICFTQNVYEKSATLVCQ